METSAILQDILDYIDAHIADDIGIDGLARRAGFSRWHFCRVFQWGVGYPVMEYVRRRRLAFAAWALGEDRRILEIALEYGFETHSGFSKAFRRAYGCAPETYRLHTHGGRPLPPSLPCMRRYAIGGIVLEPKFITRPALRLAGYGLKTTTAENQNARSIPAFWDAYLRDGRMERLHAEPFVEDHTEYGACFPEDPETGEFEYVIGLVPRAGAEIPDGYRVWELPEAEYAVFSTPPCDAARFSPTIQGVWDFIFNEWFPQSGYEYAPGCVDFERYDQRCMSETGKVCDVYIPVVRKPR